MELTSVLRRSRPVRITSYKTTISVWVLIGVCVLLAGTGRAASSGSLDLTFGGLGTSLFNIGTTSMQSRVVLIQPDGKIVLAGFVQTCSGGCSSNFLLIRYHGDGTLDNDFGSGGHVITDHFGQDEAIFAAALQPDGKIVVAGGYHDITNAVDYTGFKVFRYMPDGSLDGTFGNAGRVYESFDDVGGTPSAIVIQPDGRIVVAGSDTEMRLFVARFNSNGGLDTTFGTAGRIVSTTYSVANIAMALQSDGKLVLAGRWTVNGWFRLIRLAPDGAPDPDFGAGGVVTSSFPAQSNTDLTPVLALLADGKILVSASYQYGPQTPPLRRFESNGAVDTTFTPYHGPGTESSCKWCVNRVAKLLPTANGSFYVVGAYRPSNIPTQMAVARYSGNGSIDRTFGFYGMGVVRHALNPANSGSWIFAVSDAVLDAEGRVVLSATSSSKIYTTRVGTTPTRGSMVSDFDGDAKTDHAVYRESTRTWYVLNSADGSFTSTRWGLAGDIIVPGDYNYDLKTDYSVTRPSNNTWYTFPEPAFGGGEFGESGEIRIPADYDGDGLADEATYGADGKWTIRYSIKRTVFPWSDPVPDATYTWGATTDVPVPADYDGDGRADLAVFRPSNGVWYIFRSSDDQPAFFHFGLGTDKVVPGDYDGDLKTDVAVFRDGTWYIWQSSDSGFRGANWGIAGDIPVPGDYDGDGRFDIAVYRPSEGIWYALRSSDQGFTAQYWGIAEDQPIPAAFVR